MIFSEVYRDPNVNCGNSKLITVFLEADAMPGSPESSPEKRPSAPGSPDSKDSAPVVTSSPNSSGFVSQNTPPSIPTSPFGAHFPGLPRMPNLMGPLNPLLPRLGHLNPHEKPSLGEPRIFRYLNFDFDIRVWSSKC